jgi:ribosomal protein S18 acetylase RimI-like enzyme
MDGAWAIAEESSINILSDKELMGAVVRVNHDDHTEFSANDVVGAWFGGVRDGGSTFSFDIVVDPAYQGKGIGRMLFDAGIAEATSCGAEKISLEVVSDVSKAMVEKEGGFTFYGRTAEKYV